MTGDPDRQSDEPYRVEQIDGPAGPMWRLTGPGLDHAKPYPHPEVREKLSELATVMNFAWNEGRRRGQ
jgi:hypothetical protein